MNRPIGLLLLFGLGVAAGFGLRVERDRRAIRGFSEPTPPTPAPATGALAEEAVRPDPAPSAPARNPRGVRFENLADSLGVSCRYWPAAEGDFHIPETTGGGVAVADFDLDGALDLFFPNGNTLKDRPADPALAATWYRSRTGGGFDDRTRAAGLNLVLTGMAATAGDVNGDGFDDLIVMTFRGARLLVNQGDGTFRDDTEAAGLTDPSWFTTGALADLDDDGHLDLYLASYALVDVGKPLECRHATGVRVYCGPSSYSPSPDRLYRSDGAGRFADVTESAGVFERVGRGLGLAIADFSGDGRPDIFVGNDKSENFLYLNEGDFRFRQVARGAGVAIDGQANSIASMGVACGDCDGNGFLDLFITGYYLEGNVLFMGQRRGLFIDRTVAAGLAAGGRTKLGFGTMFLDADLDGRLDLAVGNGHIDRLESAGVPWKMNNQLYLGDGGGRFTEITDLAGAPFRRKGLARGMATGDLDGDGRPDLVIVHHFDAPEILMNRTERPGRWIGVDAVGRTSPRDGSAVRVTVTAGGVTRLVTQVPGAGYASSSDRRLLIGLGDAERPERVEVTWPSGLKRTLSNPSPGRYHLVAEPDAP